MVTRESFRHDRKALTAVAVARPMSQLGIDHSIYPLFRTCSIHVYGACAEQYGASLKCYCLRWPHVHRCYGGLSTQPDP